VPGQRYHTRRFERDVDDEWEELDEEIAAGAWDVPGTPEGSIGPVGAIIIALIMIAIGIALGLFDK
jgi:hypothetical protein